MKDLNLVLKYQLKGEDHLQVHGAARIKIDGLGGLMFYDVQNGANTRIELSNLQSFSMLPIAFRPGANAYAAI